MGNPQAKKRKATTAAEEKSPKKPREEIVQSNSQSYTESSQNTNDSEHPQEQGLSSVESHTKRTACGPCAAAKRKVLSSEREIADVSSVPDPQEINPENRRLVIGVSNKV